MTKHSELIDRIPWTGHICQQKILRLTLHLCLQMCVNMADSTQLSAVGGRYLGEIMISFHILNRD